MGKIIFQRCYVKETDNERNAEAADVKRQRTVRPPVMRPSSSLTFPCLPFRGTHLLNSRADPTAERHIIAIPLATFPVINRYHGRSQTRKTRKRTQK